MKYFTKKIIAVLLTVMLTGITVLHVSGGQTIKVNAAQTFKVHFIDVGAADGALLQYGEGENAKYALIDSGAYSYETTDYDTIDVSDRVHQYLLDHGVKHLEFVVLTHPHGDHIGGILRSIRFMEIHWSLNIWKAAKIKKSKQKKQPDGQHLIHRLIRHSRRN